MTRNNHQSQCIIVLSYKLKLGPQVAKVQVDDELPQILQIGRLIPSKELEKIIRSLKYLLLIEEWNP